MNDNFSETVLSGATIVAETRRGGVKEEEEEEEEELHLASLSSNAGERKTKGLTYFDIKASKHDRTDVF